MTQETAEQNVPFLIGQCQVEMGKMHLPIFGWKRKEEFLQNLSGINTLAKPEEIAERDFEKIQKVYNVIPEKETDFMHLACRYMGDRVNIWSNLF